jgi:hypothetical protein
MATSSIALRVGASIACAATLSLAACSDSIITPPARSASSDAANLAQNPDIISANGRHVFHTKQWFDANNAAGNGHGKPGGGGTTNNGITYHGGPVLQSGTNVVAVYWASARIYNNGPTPGAFSLDNSGDQSLVGSFLRSLGGSAYFAINSTYTDGSGHAIANSVTYSGYWANNTNVPSNGQNVSDSDMLGMLSSGFQSGALSYEPNTLYAIFTAGTVNLGGGFGSQYCAYHWYGTVNTKTGPQTIRYAAMPYDHAYPGSCDVIGNSPANGSVDPGADAEVNTLAHETEETTTDEFGTAWYDTRGYENADKCAWTFGTTFTTASGGVANVTLGGKSYLIQRNWLNANGGLCTMQWP